MPDVKVKRLDGCGAPMNQQDDGKPVGGRMEAFGLDFEKHPQLRFRIDSFSVPASVRAEFDTAMRRNFAFIQTLPGFLRHLVFEKVGGPSTFNIVTIAVWESPDAIDNAIAAVRAYYERIGFNPAAATAEWGVTSEVGQYHALGD